MQLLGDEEINAIENLIKNQKRLFRYQSDGPSECDLFEKEFSNFIGSPHSLLLSSGTNSLILALKAGGIQPGDEVLIPAYTFVATAVAVLQIGAIPIVVNIDSQLSLDFNEAGNLVSNKTKALILVHMDGLVANVKQAVDFCNKHKLLFVEDVAQAIGGRFENAFLGTFGKFGCYSLNENKNISCGEGGILVTNDSVLYQTAFCLHDTPVQYSPSRKIIFKDLAPLLGYSMRVSEIQGTIMRVQLKRLSSILVELKKRKDIFVNQLEGATNTRVIKGYDTLGECGSSLHLSFESEATLRTVFNKAQEKGILLFPATARPAHAVWQWSSLVTKYAEGTSYSNAKYLSSVSTLTSILKLDLRIQDSPAEIEQKASELKKILINS